MSGTPTPSVALIDVLLAPAYVNDLSRLPIDELRSRRTLCAMVESSLSYERQLVQGRLDIVRDEQIRRQERRSTDGAALVARLPAILTQHVHSVGVGRPPTFLYPLEVDPDRLTRLYRVAPAEAMAGLPALSSPEMATMLSGLEEIEKEVSSLRHALHRVFDLIQREAIRRYTSGEEEVRSFFTGPPAEAEMAGQPEPDGR